MLGNLPLTPLLVSAGGPLRDITPPGPRGVSSSGEAISMLVAEVIIKAQVQAVTSSRCAAPSISARLRLGINSKNESKNEKTQDPGHGRSFLASFQTELKSDLQYGSVALIYTYFGVLARIYSLKDGKTRMCDDLQLLLLFGSIQIFWKGCKNVMHSDASRQALCS